MHAGTVQERRACSLLVLAAIWPAAVVERRRPPVVVVWWLFQRRPAGALSFLLRGGESVTCSIGAAVRSWRAARGRITMPAGDERDRTSRMTCGGGRRDGEDLAWWIS